MEEVILRDQLVNERKTQNTFYCLTKKLAFAQTTNKVKQDQCKSDSFSPYKFWVRTIFLYFGDIGLILILDIADFPNFDVNVARVCALVV